MRPSDEKGSGQMMRLLIDIPNDVYLDHSMGTHHGMATGKWGWGVGYAETEIFDTLTMSSLCVVPGGGRPRSCYQPGRGSST